LNDLRDNFVAVFHKNLCSSEFAKE